MARIPDTEIERLKAEVSLVRLIEADGIALSKQGKDYAACCPFHEETTPSLIVTPSKNLFHCFGCGVAGGPIDWLMKRRGISFRHATELLREGLPLAASAATVKHASVRTLPMPVAVDADDQAALGQVVDYYHASLKQSPEALAYLKTRGLDHPELIDTFRLGYANRTLGLRLPEKNRVAGAEVRGRLQRLGVYRDSGHEHFNGSLVVPVFDLAGNVVELYGRKVRDDLRPGTPKHLYLPGPHAGVWNEAALAASREVILCEALIDAMTFWCAGYRNVTASYGTQGFTDTHLAAFQRHGIERVLIAYDRDEAGERATQGLAERLQAAGFGVYRIPFPKGMDANDYALKVQPAAKSLGLLIRKAAWLGDGQAPKRPLQAACETEAITAGREIPEPDSPPILAAKKMAEPVIALPAAAVPPGSACDVNAEVSEQEVVMRFGEGDTGRRWRIRGLPKNLAVGVLKVNLMVSQADAFHVDTLDLYAARARAVFVQQAAAELRMQEAVLKAELGRVLLKLEQVQDDTIREALEPKAPPVPAISEDEQQAALALLRTPDLLGRVLADFEQCGIVGEATNKLTAYLAATSRKLDRPLAVVVQSSSAAGKSSLMDAVLAFMPPEETVRYSAMSGQSLFYMGETNLKHKVLAIAEEEGASRASYALKLLQSDGELTMASTGTDANGNLVAQEYRVEGPMSLFMTTTAIDIDEELLNRCLVLSVDEGREQTAAIHRRQRERRTLAGFMGKETKDAVLALHRNAQRLLRPLAVVNPYADQLTFLDDRTRTRRDHEKYLSLIDTIALLHQYQRPIKTLTVGDRQIDYVEVTPQDIAQANTLAHEVLGRSLDELPPQTRKLLACVQQLVRERADTAQLLVQDIRFSRAEVRHASGLSDTQCRLHLDRLAALEYLLVHRGCRGQSFEYELLFDGDLAAHSPQLAGLLDVTQLMATGTTDSSRGEHPQFAGSTRPQNGPVAVATRKELSAQTSTLTRLITNEPNTLPETRHPLSCETRSYTQPVIVVTGV
ncbi:CHC2 zinc finger domain-containing protein [Chitinimonas sp. BJB300]|uniref:CHC2 zinc finger domain-containing protein n=3 Tax=Chitinimonas sp. BJB300 TaxID=1559339 RepID=UPI001182309A|nr:CHC2 zinc finger domain-containing protein [Chitinimonas sp. BJB300]TSJ88233.1 toprim domain-containing protein [Chitinimonas sp. BJB300]